MPNVQSNASTGHPRTPSNVVSLCERRRLQRPRVIRVTPEFDGIELLYANERFPDKLFALRVLAWGLQDDQEVVALVPWMKQVVRAQDLTQSMEARWIGYRLPQEQSYFTEPPEHKVTELESALAFFGELPSQEVPDTIGTHVVFSDDGLQSISLTEVVSWQLDEDGILHAMVADEDRVTRTPVLPGDPCLDRADEMEDFCYFFQHGIANRVKDHDPEALAAIATLGQDLS